MQTNTVKSKRAITQPKPNQTHIQTFLALAGQCDAAGNLPVTVTIHLHVAELMALARRSRATGESIDSIIEKFVGDGPNNAGGIIEDLRDYQNEIPAREVA